MPLFQGFRPVAGTICPSRAAAVVGPPRASQGMKKGRRPRRRPRLKLSDRAGPDQCPVPGENALFPAQIAGFLAVSRPVPVYPVFLNYVVPVQLDDDLLVIAGDNVLDFSLSKFVAYAQQKKTSCIMRYYEPEEKKLMKCGVVELDDQDKILSMEEKPAQPKSHWCCPPFYVYTRADARKVKDAIAQKKCGTDAPGSFIAWLCTVADVHAMEMPGKRYDIGNLESYQQVQQEYQGIKA